MDDAGESLDMHRVVGPSLGAGAGLTPMSTTEGEVSPSTTTEGESTLVAGALCTTAGALARRSA